MQITTEIMNRVRDVVYCWFNVPPSLYKIKSKLPAYMAPRRLCIFIMRYLGIKVTAICSYFDICKSAAVTADSIVTSLISNDPKERTRYETIISILS